MTQPVFWSLALADLAQPDYADVVIETLPPFATTDAVTWARCMFSVGTMPRWVLAALALRQALAPLIGVPKAPRDVFAIRRVDGGEALMSYDDVHLDFRCAVAVDVPNRLVRVTTTVRLKGWRGHLYFIPVRVGHPIVTRSMLIRARKELAVPIVAW